MCSLTGLYARHVLPKLINAACAQKPMAEVREQYVARARGAVLEIGFGTGLNLAHYATGESAPANILALEPAPDIAALAGERLAKTRLDVELLQASAEEIPAENGSFDTVLSTWTLCSVANVYRALDELRRVLKPGGKLIFIEHGASPEAKWLAWQRRLEPAWKLIGGGCHLSRKPDRLVTAAGFRIDRIETSYLPGPKFATFTYRGVASRR